MVSREQLAESVPAYETEGLATRYGHALQRLADKVGLGAHEWQRRWPQMGRTYDKCFDQDPTEALDLLYDLLYLQHCDVALVRPAALRSSACPDTKPCWHTGGRGRGSWRRDLAE